MLGACHRIEQALREGRTPDTRDFLSRLGLHLRQELSVVYAPLRGRAEMRTLLAEIEQRQWGLKRLGAQLASLTPGDDRWVLTFEELADLLRAHFAEEEDLVFKKLRHFCKEDQLVAMARDFLTQRLGQTAA